MILEKEKMFLIFLGNIKVIFSCYKKHWPSNAENVVRSQWGCECVVVGHDSGSKDVAIL